MNFKLVIKELVKTVRFYDREANEVFGEYEYEYNRRTLMRDKFAAAIKILSEHDSTGENNCNLADVSNNEVAVCPDCGAEAKILSNGFLRCSNWDCGNFAN